MAAHGKYLKIVSSATAGSVVGEIAEASLTVPTGVSWILDFITIESTPTSANIEVLAAGNNVWETFVASEREDLDFATRYPRALQVDEGETIVARLTTTTVESVTVTLKVWVIEG